MSDSTGKGFAVVGTDTGVGKTFVTAGLVGWLRDEGLDARAIKPAQTGHPPDDDAGFVASACESEEAATCLTYLEPPLAPSVAAEREGTALSYEQIYEECLQALDAVAVGIVEGIGGVRVPLADGHEVIDLIDDLALPAVVVSRSGLGTLNHTALTVRALRNRKIPVEGIVLNRYKGETVAERTNPDVLEEMTGCSVWTLPELSVDSAPAVVRHVREELPCSVLPPVV